MAGWYFGSDYQGPYTIDQLSLLASEGRIDSETVIYNRENARTGMTVRQLLSQAESSVAVAEPPPPAIPVPEIPEMDTPGIDRIEKAIREQTDRVCRSQQRLGGRILGCAFGVAGTTGIFLGMAFQVGPASSACIFLGAGLGIFGLSIIATS